ncbi:unnamed protein product [Diabrotica balteata]|uniref:Uncharacterized protein n=1 Tax=Diabrotica balteata TaxID=107213 RepID=A0A9N9XI12_DIABA|nr:unnamed protein product [Diabrotica balteata]
MHADYLQKYSENKVSYYTYRKVMSDMYISFTKLGNEECDYCILHIQHVKSHNEAIAITGENVVEIVEGSNEDEKIHGTNINQTTGSKLSLLSFESASN